MKASRILIVDDSYSSLEIVQIACAGLDCEIDVAESGEDALKLFAQNHYGFVLTDYRMPRINGIDLVHGMRRLNPDIDCIIYTGFPDDHIEQFCKHNERCTYMRKPVNLPHLVDLIKQSLFTEQADNNTAAIDAEIQNCAPLAGHSLKIQEIRGQIASLQNTHHPVLLEGGDLASRRMIARQIHALSRRKKRKLVEHFCHHNESQAVWQELINGNCRHPSLISSAVGSSLLLNDLQYLHGDIQRPLAEEFQTVFENIRLLVTVEYPHAPQTAATYSIYLQLYSLVSETLVELPSLSERQEDIPSILAAIAHQPQNYQISRELASNEIVEMIQKVPRTKPLRNFEDCIRHVAYFAGGTDGRLPTAN